MDESVLQKYLEAGRIAAQCRELAKSKIVISASLKEVTEAVEQKIFDLNGKPAFPVQISLNKFAAHYCASADDSTVFAENDMVKVDIGVHVDGYIGDTACTVYLGNDEQLKLLAKSAEEALEAAIKIIKPGLTLGEIGTAIEKEITKHGFSPIRNLTGHGLGEFDIHASPQIPNLKVENNVFLHEDQVIAIEPFATSGKGLVGQGGNAEVLQMISPKSVRSPITREVMKELTNYGSLPFCRRWIIKKFGPVRTNFALREMTRLGMLHEYPPLPEVSGAPVSQAEHTIIVRTEQPIVTTRL